tara:strand:- start:21701 stop:21946 length:246 start_codon:yes stop_codon:yes gene_type:complete
MTDESNTPILPYFTSPISEYCVITDKFFNWKLMHIDISRNDFLSCHRVSTVNAWNLHMPPVNFGSISADYQSIKYYIQSLG